MHASLHTFPNFPPISHKTSGLLLYTRCMQVYIELAFVENFCMDFFLLACAKLLTKNLCGYGRIAVASALGACFAVIFPLIPAGGALAIVIKVASGLLLAAAAGRFKGFASYAKFAAVFFAVSLIAGGAIFALFSLAGWSFSSGGGYIISSVPVGIPLFAVLLLALACRALARRFRARGGGALYCVVSLGARQVKLPAFFDSGNKVYSGGVPVSIIPPRAAVKLGGPSEGCVTVRTVSGMRRINVFTADKIQIYTADGVHTIEYVKIGISPQPIARAVLHPDLAEQL